MVQVELKSEDQRVIEFKLEWLLHAGYNRRNANRIAKDLEIDWHMAVDILKHSNDQPLCMRILYADD